MAFGDFTVARTSVKHVLNASGVLASVAADTPAFEFNADGSYRGLLVEPAGTNLALRSEAFDNASWSKDATSSITATNGVAPDGTSTADTYTLGAVPGTARIQQSFTVASGATVTGSVFVKKSVGTHIRFAIADSATAVNSYGGWFNLDTGAVGTTGGAGTGTFTSASIQAYPNSWYRISVTGAIPATTGYQFSLFIASADNTGTRLANGAVLLWGAQLETGAVATSYIPTVASTETRTADSVTLTGASSLIGQSAGSIYVEFEFRNTGAVTRVIGISNGDADFDDTFRINKGATGTVVSAGTTLGVSQFSITSSGTYVGQIVRVALGYATNDVAFYAQGAQIGTDNSSTTPTLSAVLLGVTEDGTGQFNGWIRAVALYPTRLPNATLASLTA